MLKGTEELLGAPGAQLEIRAEQCCTVVAGALLALSALVGAAREADVVAPVAPVPRPLPRKAHRARGHSRASSRSPRTG